MVAVAQLVRAPGCGPGGRGFKSHQPPHFSLEPILALAFIDFKGLRSLGWYKMCRTLKQASTYQFVKRPVLLHFENRQARWLSRTDQ